MSKYEQSQHYQRSHVARVSKTEISVSSDSRTNTLEHTLDHFEGITTLKFVPDLIVKFTVATK